MALGQRKGIFTASTNNAANRGADRSAATAAGNNSQPVEVVISVALRCGVLISSGLIAAGMFLLLLSRYGGLGHPTVFSILSSGSQGDGAFHSLGGVVSGLSQFDPNAVATLGLLILMVTPVVPIILSAISYIRARDLPYVVITLLVLVVLAASLLLGANV